MQVQQSAEQPTNIWALDYVRVMHIQEGVEEQNVLFHSFMHKTLQGLQATLAAK